MNREIVVLLVVSLVAGFTILTLYGDNFEQRPDQDVMLIAVDTLRSDYIDCKEAFNRTPNICKLKNESVSFNNSYSHASYTVPAMSTVMTGRYPWNIDMLDIHSSEIPEDVETLAEVLESEGYKNYASWEIGSVGPEYGFNRGFETYMHTDLYVNTDLYKKKPERERHLSLLDTANDSKRPSFVYYHLFGPHQPFRDSEECRNFSKRLRNTPWIDIYDVGEEYRDDFSNQKARECYTEAVKLADTRVGNIVEKLKENDQYNDTLIIFTADHGEGLWDNNIFGHSYSVYEEQIAVPLYFKFPESSYGTYSKGEIEEGYARHIDIYPTVLDYLGIDYSSSNRPGKSLLPGIKTGELESKLVKATSVEARGMIIDDYKMIETFGGWPGCEYSRCEYFKNIAGDKSEIQRDEVPEKYLERFMSNIPEIGIHKMENSSEEMHEESLRNRLEDLGYLLSTNTDNEPDDDKESFSTTESVNEQETHLNISDAGNVVKFTENGFEPSEIRINEGERIIWVDQFQDIGMWVASNPHPIHTGYDGSSLEQHCTAQNHDAFDQCGAGDMYGFTFNKEGEWNYHNHMSSEYTGKVIVEDR